MPRRGEGISAVLGVAVLLLSGCATGESVNWSQARSVAIHLTDYRFTPARLVLVRDTPYQLVLINDSRSLHEFTAPAFLREATVADPGILAGGREVVLQPGATKKLVLVPLKPGRYPLTCADHEFLGMEGTIVVE